MDLKQHQDDELLGRLFTGRGSRADDAELERRLDADAAFRRQFFAALDMKVAVDRNRAFLANELTDLAPTMQPVPTRSRTPWLAAAAAAVLLVGAAAIYLRNGAGDPAPVANVGGPALQTLASMGACYADSPDGRARAAELSVCDLAIGKRGTLLRLFPQSAVLIREDAHGLTVELTQGAALLSSPRQASDYAVHLRAAGREARFLGTAVFGRVQEGGARNLVVVDGQAEVSERTPDCLTQTADAQSPENSVVVEAGREVRDDASSSADAQPAPTAGAGAGCRLIVADIAIERRGDLDANVASLRRSADRAAASGDASASQPLPDEDIETAARVILTELSEGLRYEVTRANGETLTGLLFQSGSFYVVLTDEGRRITLQSVQVKEIRVLAPEAAP